jgi:glucose-6-phosphate 1-dehydrogenase
MPKLPADHLTIRIQPDEGISLAIKAKRPGPGYELQTVVMDFDYDRSFSTSRRGNEPLPRDAMTIRQREIVTPILEQPAPLFFYKRGSWGPAQSDELIEPHDWHLRTRPAGVHHTLAASAAPPARDGSTSPCRSPPIC